MAEKRAPEVLPPGWDRLSTSVGSMATRFYKDGLLVTASYESYELGEDGPFDLAQTWLCVVFSRANRHPRWEEMRDALRDRIPWWDNAVEGWMCLPPPDRYINVCEHAFHWWQPVGESDAA